MLKEDQQRTYEETGYLLGSGLMPPEIAAAAEAAMWAVIGARPGDPASWAEAPRAHQAFESPEILACYTPAYLEAAAQLAGEEPGSLRPPKRPYSINVFPSEGPWQWPKPHIDHAIKEHGHRTFPRAFRIAAMTFL